jgi:hypothetical protein
MVLNIVVTILGIIFLVFFESFLLALVNFRFSIIIFFFLFKKIDWKLLIIPFGFLLLIFDVVKNLPLGTNLLILSIVLGFFVLLSLIFSVEGGLTGFFVKGFLFFLYYLLLLALPKFLSVGTLGDLSLRNVIVSFAKGFLSSLILILLDNTFANFRKRGNSSQISLK